MAPQPLETIRAAEEAVTRLVEVCHKGGSLYKKDPRTVAQASRTGKWLLNAIAALRKVLASVPQEQDLAGTNDGKRSN